jgi:hypothetical protein
VELHNLTEYPSTKLRAYFLTRVLRDKAIKPLIAAAQPLHPARGAHNPKPITISYALPCKASFTSSASPLDIDKIFVGLRPEAPNRTSKSAARKREQKKCWFRNGQKWRTGCDGRISVIKRRHGLARSRYQGDDGMKRWVELGVIADNLVNLGRALAKPPDAKRRHPSRRVTLSST